MSKSKHKLTTRSALKPAAQSPNPQFKTPSRLKLIREHRLAKLFDVDPSTIWRWKRDGILPEPIKIGGIVGWPEHQLLDLLARHQASEEREA